VARSTGNLKLAMQYIGDTEIRREYMQVRPDHSKALRDGSDLPNRSWRRPSSMVELRL
jgi:hypothetical protein